MQGVLRLKHAFPRNDKGEVMDERPRVRTRGRAVHEMDFFPRNDKGVMAGGTGASLPTSDRVEGEYGCLGKG